MLIHVSVRDVVKKMALGSKPFCGVFSWVGLGNTANLAELQFSYGKDERLCLLCCPFSPETVPDNKKHSE
jgi:hypothetical protein